MSAKTPVPLEEFLADVNASQYGWPESLRFTYDKVRELLAAGVPGDLVECGVGNGCHPAAMWRASLDASEPRWVRLFDSFQGVPNGGRHDTEWNREHGDGTGRLEPTGIAACSLAEMQRNLERWGCGKDAFAFYVGWFQDMLPRVAPVWQQAVADGRSKGIAFLRLDGDLYESTLVCLQHLEPLVVSGGVIVVDDWNLDGCRAAVASYLRETYGCELWATYDAQRREGATGMMGDASIEIAPVTASGDVWWAKP